VNLFARWLAAVAFTGSAFAPRLSEAQLAPSSTPLPVPSPTSSPPSGPSDPCTSMLALVNRPTVATGSCVFKNGRGDIETGYANTITSGLGGGATAAYPQAFIRAGTRISNVEIDITPPSVLRTSAGGLLSGTADAAYGAKWEIGYTSKAIGSLSVAATVPTGDLAFTAGGSSYIVNLNGAYTLNSEFSVSGTLGFQSLAARSTTGAVERTGVFIPAFVVVAALPGTAQVYGEVSNVSHIGVGQPGRTLYDFGVQKQLGTHIVIDLETGFAPNPVAGQKLHYIGFGLSYGTPNP